MNPWRQKIYIFLFLAVFILLGFFGGRTEKVAEESMESESTPTTMPEGLTTETWGIFEPVKGDVLYGEDTNTARSMASLTKLFTAYAVLESAVQHESFSISYADTSTEGRAGNVKAGETYTSYELLFPLLLESSNDAAEAIRRHLGSTYMETLDTTIGDLHLKDTVIADASGLSEHNVSSVEDLSHFYGYLYNTQPHLLDITALHAYSGENSQYQNINPGRTLPNFTGGKHGYTPEAGRTFIGTFVTQDGNELGMVLLGSADLVHDIDTLLGFIADADSGSGIMTP